MNNHLKVRLSVSVTMILKCGHHLEVWLVTTTWKCTTTKKLPTNEKCDCHLKVIITWNYDYHLKVLAIRGDRQISDKEISMYHHHLKIVYM